jgi:hypothetical protein
MEFSFTEDMYRVTLRNEDLDGRSRWVFHVDRAQVATPDIAAWDSVVEGVTHLPADLSHDEAQRAVRRIADTLLPMLNFADETQIEAHAKHLAQTVHLNVFDTGCVTLEAKVVSSNNKAGMGFKTTAPLGLPLRLYRLIAVGMLSKAGVLGGEAKMTLNGKLYDLP